MSDSALDKSQAPTPHRRQQASEEGQAVQSADLAAAGILIAGLAILLMLGSRLVEFFARFAQHQLGGESWLQADSNFIVVHTNALLFELAQSLAPILGLLLLAAVLVHILQTGFLWSLDRLSPDLNRINPLSGLRRIFSLSSATRLGMGLLKLLTVSLVAFSILYARRDEILAWPPSIRPKSPLSWSTSCFGPVSKSLWRSSPWARSITATSAGVTNAICA